MSLEKVLVKKGIGPIRFSYNKNGLVHRFATILGVDILVKASAFILLPVFLHLMTQEDFGLYNYSISIIQTFSLVLNFGLYIPISKLYHSKALERRKGELLFTVIITLFSLILVLTIPLILFKLDIKLISFLFENQIQIHQLREIIWISILISVLSFILTNFLYTSEKIKDVKKYNLSRIILVNVVAIIALLIFKQNNSVVVRLSATYLMEFFLLLLFGIIYIKNLKLKFDKSLMVKALKMGLPIMISAIFGIAVNFSDKYLLQHYGSLKDLSNYYLAFSFASILSVIFASLQNVWLPLFMKEHDLDVNFNRTKKLVSKIVLYFLILSILIWGLFIIMIWSHLISNKYFQVIWILPILLVTQTFNSLSALFSNYIIYFEKTFIVTVTGLIVSVISISLGLWLIPKWNVFGASITTFTVNLVYLLTYYSLVLYYKKKYRLKAI